MEDACALMNKPFEKVGNTKAKAITKEITHLNPNLTILSPYEYMRLPYSNI
ncbi:hypothetical protein B4096_0597 [Heyndrickxia coagulans]|uniref:Uncharacterized protein n=1 Tax=Heyndrickxia coagulans TaxID=1398 RepID=A0A150K5U5_HEYCO|nr:hypothetical protein B4098_0498 [Heyndrickxia coagulans]KYC85623.1 hypothetical protein B4096_0597 [Heyndrickxia coagulans]